MFIWQITKLNLRVHRCKSMKEIWFSVTDITKWSVFLKYLFENSENKVTMVDQPLGFSYGA